MADTTNAANIPITQATVVYAPTGVPLAVTATPAVVGPGAGATAARTVSSTDDVMIGITRLINAAFTTLTRPANTTPYTANDSISNNATAGSVTTLVATVSDVNDAPIGLTGIRVHTTDTGLGGKSLRAYVFNSDPTASSGVVAGDNVAFNNKKAGLVGTFTGTLSAMNDGAVGTLIPESGEAFIACPVGSGVKTVWIEFQTLSDFTPSANSTTIIATAIGFQGRA